LGPKEYASESERTLDNEVSVSAPSFEESLLPIRRWPIVCGLCGQFFEGRFTNEKGAIYALAGILALPVSAVTAAQSR
jgi:hypothetical protein